MLSEKPVRQAKSCYISAINGKFGSLNILRRKRWVFAICFLSLHTWRWWKYERFQRLHQTLPPCYLSSNFSGLFSPCLVKSGTIGCSSPLCWRCHPNLKIAIFDKNFCVIIEIEPLHPDFRRNEGLCRYNTFFCHACGLLKMPDHCKEGVRCFDWFWWSVCIWTRAWGKSLKVQLASSNPRHFCFSVWNTISTEMTGSKPKPGNNPSHPSHISNWTRISYEKVWLISGQCHSCPPYQADDP